MKRTFIFDFDGTLADTFPLILYAFGKGFEAVDMPIPSNEDMVSHFGPSEEGFFKAYNADKANTMFAAYIQAYESEHEKFSPRPFDNMVEIFNYIKAKGDNLGLITGKCLQSAKISLKHYGIDFGIFDFVRTGSPDGNTKPQAMKDAREYFKENSSEYYYIGDALSDIKDAQESGFAPIAAAWASHADKPGQLKLDPYKQFTTTKDFFNWLKALK